MQAANHLYMSSIDSTYRASLASQAKHAAMPAGRVPVKPHIMTHYRQRLRACLRLDSFAKPMQPVKDSSDYSLDLSRAQLKPL